MQVTKHAFAALLVAATLAAPTYAASNSRDSAFQELAARSAAMNARYHLNTPSRSRGHSPIAASAATIAAAQRATALRSQALNRDYRLGQFASARRGGFAWGDSGIGAAAMLGIVLVAAGAVSARRRARRDHATTTQPSTG